jgi:hypothetical protein
MATSTPCPRCAAPRLLVVYYDAGGSQIGGRLECTQCGPRQATILVRPTTEVQQQLLERKAS